MENPAVKIADQKILEPYGGFELIDDLHELVNFRSLIEEARKKLMDLIRELDERLIMRMDEENVHEFQFGMEGSQSTIKKAKEAKHKIKDTGVLRKMLVSENPAERELANKALAGGQSAWKIPKVRELADTLGLDLIETTFSDKVVIKVVPTDMLKQTGKI